MSTRVTNSLWHHWVGPFRPKQQYCCMNIVEGLAAIIVKWCIIYFCLWILWYVALWHVISSISFLLCYNSCAYFPTFFCSLGTNFEQGLSGDKSSTIGSGELINDSVPPKDPEEGGLLLPEPSYAAVISVLYPCLKAECYLTSLGENCEGNADPENFSDINDVEVLSHFLNESFLSYFSGLFHCTSS